MLPLVITVGQADGGTRRYAFADSPVSIGRNPFAELQLTEPFVSRWEGTLRFDATEITFFNLGSTNATYVDGKQLTQFEDDIPLSVNSVLKLGDLELRFSREPVPEADLRRKGKRRPTRENTATALKTQYLDAAAWAQLVPARAAAAAAPRAGNGAPFAVVAPKRVGTIAPQSCITLGDASAPRRSPSTGPTLVELDVAAALPALEGSRPSEPTAGATDGASAAARFAQRRDAYHEARAALIADIRSQHAALSNAERAESLAWLVRREPTLASDPDLQLELQAAGVQPSPHIPELRDWLRAISPELAPNGVPFDAQPALTRVLALLEVLIQSLAEIHDAQESVRRRWLGRSARRSVLQSDDGNAVLAYLLNPRADWNDRLRELEQSVRDAVTHELALFRATLDGARSLMHTLSPETIASSAAAAEDDTAGPEPLAGFWTRLLCKDAGDIGMWRKFLALYEELTDGARYERVFLGRVFSRSYLAAMGRPEHA
ncbi:MAG TPA: FHA domain-containing protein [Polyangiaceae bacterium]|nr:FHA domain-containing protein [Polyangiaceae bacterium]